MRYGITSGKHITFDRSSSKEPPDLFEENVPYFLNNQRNRTKVLIFQTLIFTKTAMVFPYNWQNRKVIFTWTEPASKIILLHQSLF
jgi:hypothetical protein